MEQTSCHHCNQQVANPVLCPIRLRPRALVARVTSLAGTTYTFAQPVTLTAQAVAPCSIRQEETEYAPEIFCSKDCLFGFFDGLSWNRKHLFSRSRQILLRQEAAAMSAMSS